MRWCSQLSVAIRAQYGLQSTSRYFIFLTQYRPSGSALRNVAIGGQVALGDMTAKRKLAMQFPRRRSAQGTKKFLMLEVKLQCPRKTIACGGEIEEVSVT